MALFKPLFGDSSRISFEKTPFRAGYVYFTQDGFLYFDINIGTETSPNNQRIKLNAGDAQTILGISPSTFLNNTDVEIPTSKAVLDKLTQYALAQHDHNDIYYTDDEIDEKVAELNESINSKVSTSRTINNKSLTSNITLTASDVGAATPSDVSTAKDEVTSYTDQKIAALGNTYYTETEINSKIATINDEISNKANATHKHEIYDVNSLQSSLDAKVPTSRKVNGKALTSDIALSASDVGAATASDIATAKTEVNKYTDDKIAMLVNNSSTAVDSINELAKAMEDNADAISALESIAAGHALKDHTHNYAGSSSVGGSANSAVKLDSSAGSATQPVFFENGKPKATTYALNATVPADAKFTDTVYTHPSHTAKSSGFYKVTVDAQGHVSGATAVTKSDITGLGIPAQDTTYGNATESKSGLMSASDKAKLNDIEILVWAGTQAEYNALSDADKEDTLCIITDSTESVNFETVANKVTAISASSTDQQYASARAIWNLVQNISGYIKSTDKSTVISNASTDDTIPSSKAVYTHTNNTVNSIKNEILTTLENRVYGVEKTTNKVTEITEDAKHTTYPSSKAVLDAIETFGGTDIETTSVIDENSTADQVPNAKAVHDFVVNHTPELPDTIPTVYTGSSEPDASLGKAGDIYFVI